VTTIAIIGLGAMGARMAVRLIEQGHRVVGWNRTEAAVTALRPTGVVGAADPAEAAEAADLVITMVADDSALRAVTEGPSGVAAGIGRGVLAQMSTVSPAAVTRLRTALPDRAGLLDAPVLGSLSEAAAGTLRIFAGAEEADLAAARGPLQALGEVIHTGPLGTGTAAKLTANSTLFGVLGVFGEALALAARLGLAPETALRVLQETPLSPQVERRRAALSSDTYPLRFALAMALKDAELIRSAADTCQIDLRLAPAARSWLTEAAESGPDAAAVDYSTVLRHILARHRPGEAVHGDHPANFRK
jgi:3-hydroxyisobutyrate dehydrogenase-like beta-hydroxyacid dehydrogenase